MPARAWMVWDQPEFSLGISQTGGMLQMVNAKSGTSKFVISYASYFTFHCLVWRPHAEQVRRPRLRLHRILQNRQQLFVSVEFNLNAQRQRGIVTGVAGGEVVHHRHVNFSEIIVKDFFQ